MRFAVGEVFPFVVKVYAAGALEIGWAMAFKASEITEDTDVGQMTINVTGIEIFIDACFCVSEGCKIGCLGTVSDPV
mgnify:CR=1 FL=1